MNEQLEQEQEMRVGQAREEREEGRMAGGPVLALVPSGRRLCVCVCVRGVCTRVYVSLHASPGLKPVKRS